MIEDIYRILEEIKPEADFRNSDNFIDEMLLESMDIISLVEKLENKYGFQFDLMDLLPETFENVESIAEAVKKYQ